MKPETRVRVMKCCDCDKRLKGGFLQPNGTHKCARCVILQVEMESIIKCRNASLRILDELLLPRVRPTKAKIREARIWVNCIPERTSR